MKKILTLLLSLILAILTLFSAFSVPSFGVEATKKEKSYEIAVVYDNSGSMYTNSKAWCKAKYAMEIFASMLDYKRDRLHIFPMWEVTTDGSTPETGGSYDPIEIASKKDIDKITNLYTVRASNTPYEPVRDAFKFLEGCDSSKEKWLIILTDGEFNQDGREKWQKNEVIVEWIKKLSTEDIVVQYVGFGNASYIPEDKADNFYSVASTEDSLKDDLIDICNTIFQREKLPNGGDSISLDLSMKNLIVFAQGDNAKITGLKNSSGEEVEIKMDSGQRKASNLSGNQGGNECETWAPVDNTLSGQVVTFGACAKGDYNLVYSGVDKDSIQVFYEPNVDLDITVTNDNGEEITESNELTAGEYTASAKLVDAITGEDVTSNPLMGDVTFTTTVTTSSGDKKEYDNGSKINFEPDEGTEISVECEYLGKYRISSKDDSMWDWLGCVKVSSEPVDFKIDADVLQSQSWFKIKDHDNWKPIKIEMTLDGQPLTDEQSANVKLSVAISGDLKYRCERIQGESAYNVYIAQDENGQYTEPETGKYKLSVSATYADEYGEETTAKDDSSFEIQKYSKFWRWLKWVIIILSIIGLLAFILTRKSFPNRIAFVEEQGHNRTRTRKMRFKSRRKIVIPIYSALTLNVKEETRLYQRFSKSASIRVDSIDKPKSTVSSFSIRGMEYSSGNGFKNSLGNSFNGVITDGTRISVTFNDGSGTIRGIIKIN